MKFRLKFFGRQGRSTRLALAIATAGAVMFTPAVFAAGGGDLPTRIGTLEQQTDALGIAIHGLREQLTLVSGQADVPVAPIVVAQSSRETGALTVRIGQLEEQVRTLTGQIEGLQFQMAQLQTLIQSMQEDNDARFAALGEGGALPGKTEAAPQAGGVTPSVEAPQVLVEPQTDSLGPRPPADIKGAIDLNAPDAGTSADASSDEFSLGAPEQPLGTLSLEDLANGLTQPMDGDPSAGALVTDADADAQYKAGYDAVIRGDYAFAEEQFRQFIALFPDHPQAPDATSWLGEALIQKAQYDDAADILVAGFQKYPNSARAPDILLKLGVALVGTGERDTACRTFAEALRRFPNQPASFNDRVNAEMAKSQC